MSAKVQQSRAKRWFEVIVGKSMSQDGEASKCFAFGKSLRHQAQTPFVRDAQISRNADEPSGHLLVGRRRHCPRSPNVPESAGRASSGLVPHFDEADGVVFLTPIDSQLNDFLNEIHLIALFEPSIVERIDEDLDLHAKKKKLLRLADEEFLAGQTLDLPKLQLQLRALKIDHIELETGRPRTDAYIGYLFLMLRGFNVGCKDQHARLLLEESIRLRLWLEHLGLELPPVRGMCQSYSDSADPRFPDALMADDR